ncbi:hypothetical protein BDV3_004424 [Batrachochytrium dendrobatidis]
MDPVAQRRLALYAFILCQTIKLANVLHSSHAVDPTLYQEWLHSDTWMDPIWLWMHPLVLLLKTTVLDLDASHLILWCCLDLVYLLLLRWARIPWLTLSMCGSLTVLLALWGINTGIIAIIASTYSQNAWDVYAAAMASGGSILAGSAASNMASHNGNAASGSHQGRSSAHVLDRPRLNVDAILNSSYIIGSHTVNVRPPIIAKLNPNNTVFCALQGFTGPSIQIPLLIKGTPPFKIDYEILLGNSKTVKKFKGIDITAKDSVTAILRSDGSLKELVPDPIASKLSSRRVGLYSLPGSSVGIYRLLSVREGNGEPGKIVASKHAQIVQCPSASWSWPSTYKSQAGLDDTKTFDRCMDEEFTASVQLTGVAPLTVMLIKQAGDAESVVTVEAVESDDSSSETISASDEIDADILALVKSARQITTTVSLTIKIDRDAPHILRIGRVIDGLNNSVNYQTQSSLRLPDPFQQSTDVSLDTVGDFFVVNGHAHPQARFVAGDSVKIRAGGQSSLGVILFGSGPFTVGMDRVTEDGTIIPDSFTVAEQGRADLLISHPGSYSLVSVSDRYCTGAIQLPSLCLAQQILPPSMTLSSEPIKEKCLGAVGANINLTFTGEPPFWVDYIEERSMIDHPKYRDDSSRFVERRDVPISNILKPRHALVLSPKETGKYRYLFTRMGDANYPEGISLDNLSVTQIIHPHSSASFSGKQSKYVRCINDTVDLSINVQGSGPWTVIYFVVHNNQRTEYSLQVPLEDASTHFTVDSLHSAGLYLVDIAEITDVNGCKENVGLSGITIEVLAQRPTVNFQTTKPVYIVEDGRASLPISVSGKGPYEITYRGADSSIQTTRNGRDLEIFGTGTFELLSIRDSVCQGYAVEPRLLEVIQIPKPSLSILSEIGLERAVCQHSHSGVQLNLSGTPPFSVEYEHTYVADRKAKPVTITNKINTSADTYPFIFDTAKAGRHVYRIISISDSHYRSKISVGVKEISLKVNLPPTIQFQDPGEHVYQCTTQKHRDAIRLGIKLSGAPPFQVGMDCTHDSLPKQFKNITLDKSVLTANADGTAWMSNVNAGAVDLPGRYTFRLVLVIDGTGCAANVPGSDRDSTAATPLLKSGLKQPTHANENGMDLTTTSIHLADQAKITSANNPSIICVGDILSYNFQGSPPFTVGYTFNGVLQPDVVIADPMMTLWAGSPGDIVITKVCNGMACCDNDVSTDPTMHTTVKGLPKAIVDGGHDMIDDIREGDASEVHVEFVGEPPFSFTYTHVIGSAAQRGAHQIDLVTNSVSNIADHHWRLSTSQEGVFRVTAIHDRFCGYPRIIQTMQGANVIIKGI